MSSANTVAVIASILALPFGFAGSWLGSFTYQRRAARKAAWAREREEALREMQGDQDEA